MKLHDNLGKNSRVKIILREDAICLLEEKYLEEAKNNLLMNGINESFIPSCVIEKGLKNLTNNELASNIFPFVDIYCNSPYNFVAVFIFDSRYVADDPAAGLTLVVHNCERLFKIEKD